MVLCLFGLCALFAYNTPQKKRVIREDQKVYLEHADELKRDIYGPNPDAQILKRQRSFEAQRGYSHIVTVPISIKSRTLLEPLDVSFPTR